jgi:predicted nucleotidyltransferase
MHETLKQEIKEYLIEKYQPEVIILHGSRASENYKPHSDWDLFVFVKQDNQSRKLSREVYKENALDVILVGYPDIGEDTLEKLVAVSHSIENLYEKEIGSGDILVEEALEKRSQGNFLSKEEKDLIVFDMFKYVNRLVDTQNDDAVFFHRLGRDFFPQALNSWFRVLSNEYSLPPYLAIPYIQEQDMKYYNLLEVLWSRGSNKDKVEAAQQIFKRIREGV